MITVCRGVNVPALIGWWWIGRYQNTSGTSEPVITEWLMSDIVTVSLSGLRKGCRRRVPTWTAVFQPIITGIATVIAVLLFQML